MALSGSLPQINLGVQGETQGGLHMETLKLLSKVFGELTTARFNVYEMHRHFKEGREPIKYNEYVGRSSTSWNA
ncbi:hypothetical protein TNCV_461441 [Trichonephila clavipes]|nr:hypothetical protein TNCV_461441 [Trichonephila clavipes]